MRKFPSFPKIPDNLTDEQRREIYDQYLEQFDEYLGGQRSPFPWYVVGITLGVIIGGCLMVLFL